MSFHSCVIVNPTSGGGATGRRWPEIRAAIDRQLERWDNQFTLHPGDATRLAREAVESGYEMIVCVGGDGTMNEVVNGLFEEGPLGITDRLLRPNIVVAAMRYGTGGDFARHLGLPTRLEEAARHLSGPQVVPCDLGLVDYVRLDGVPARRAFLNISSFGLSGVVDEKVNRATKMFGGRVSFLLGLGRALVSYRPQNVRIRVDGRDFYEGPMVTAAVANGRYFGGGMCIARDAQIADGLFDVVVQLRSGVKEVVQIGDVYSGRMAEWGSVRTVRGVEVEAEPEPESPEVPGQEKVSARKVLLDVDGEQPGCLPARFRLLPGAIRVKVP